MVDRQRVRFWGNKSLCHAGWLAKVLTAALVVGAVGAATGCGQLSNPTADVELQQSMYDLQDLIMGMQEQTAELQAQVDSLRIVVAQQDTLVRQMAGMAGLRTR